MMILNVLQILRIPPYIIIITHINLLNSLLIIIIQLIKKNYNTMIENNLKNL